MTDTAWRAQLADFLDWHSAHVGFDAAVKGLPPRLRGVVPAGFAHSAWQVLEHIRTAQADILEFCRSTRYREKKWPEDYWPKSAAPRNADAWTGSLAAFRRDRKAMQRLAIDRRIDLLAKVPNGTDQTYLREVLLVADHTAYHVAQIVDIRRTLGNWKP
ncbi:MAG: DinB family protein [Acidobacteriota bacterium]